MRRAVLNHRPSRPPAIFLAAVALLLLLVACGRDGERPDAGAQAAVTGTSPPTFTMTPPPTFTLTPSPSPTATPTATPTPTPTITPTPTARPATITGNPRPAGATTPVPQIGAPCGVVDLFDYPVYPPDADDGRLIQEFANTRRRGGYHAGEDWAAERGSSFGEPVYSAGHGQVIYAAPNGWGTDRGVVIVEHTFPGGDTLLSFYGHLDPPSVVLRSGQCVARGEHVGDIGRPRTPPHLHFEMRTHLPDEPGPGYWGPDLVFAGWRSPSQVIWNLRHRASAGVQWVYPFSFSYLDRYAGAIGPVRDNTFVILEPDILSGIDLTYGRRRWRVPPDQQFVAGLASPDGSSIYVVDEAGAVLAITVPPMEEDPATFPPPPTRTWTHPLSITQTTSLPTLMPLPGGGVVVSTWGITYDGESRDLFSRREMTALSPGGDLLWEETLSAPAVRTMEAERWTLDGERLIFATTGPQSGVWMADEDGVTLWTTELTGQPLPAEGGAYVYAEDGVYRLTDGEEIARLLYPLPDAYLELGHALILPDGRLLLAHRDRRDRRLILLHGDGSLQWERSLGDLAGTARLLLLDGRPYLTLQDDATDVTKLNVYALDLETAGLTHLFTGGGVSEAREQAPPITSFAANGRLLLPIHGSGLVVLDPLAAAGESAQAE